VDSDSVRRGRIALGLTTAGFLLAAALIPAGFLVPVYGGVSEDASGATATFSSTLVEENGLSVVLVLALPAVVALLVWFALHRKCSRGGARSGGMAWALVAVLGAFSLLGAATIGVFSMPIVALLAGAAAVTPAPSTPESTRI